MSEPLTAPRNLFFARCGRLIRIAPMMFGSRMIAARAAAIRPRRNPRCLTCRKRRCRQQDGGHHEKFDALTHTALRIDELIALACSLNAAKNLLPSEASLKTLLAL